MNILHVTASPQGAGGASYKLSEHVVRRLRQRHPNAVVVERPLWHQDLPPLDAGYATALASPTGEGTGDSLARSDLLIEELEAADILVIGTPMHNLTVPAVLKDWIDHVVRAHRTMRMTAQGKVGALADRPVYIAISSGGWRTGPNARHPDFLEPYLRAVLPMIGLSDITVFSMEGTAFGPERAELAHIEAYGAIDAHFADQRGEPRNEYWPACHPDLAA
jgi:FMN-dependent NADH-azoreductase